MTRNFRDMLEAKWADGKLVCVGLDSDIEKMPPSLHGWSNPADTIESFNNDIVDATQDLVLSYKPNFAFYLRYGMAGLDALERTIKHIRKVAPEIPINLDMKDADIDNTNNGYVEYALSLLNVDAVTVNPYLGAQAMKPFLERKDKGIFVLCRTSNKGADEFQDVEITLTEKMFVELSMAQSVDNERYGMPSRMPLYQYVAHRVASRRAWNGNGNCGVVVGATVPAQLEAVRKIVGDMPILIPGIGAQGGDLEATIAAGKDSRGCGMIINSSRGIIFASDGEDFAEAARRETKKLHDQIRACLNP